MRNQLYLGAFALLSKESLVKKETTTINDYACCGKHYPFLEMMSNIEGTFCKFCGKKIEKQDIPQIKDVRFEEVIDGGKYEELMTFSYNPDFLYIIPKSAKIIYCDEAWERPKLVSYCNIESDVERVGELIKKSGIIDDMAEFTGGTAEWEVEFGLLID